jgi:hypothetical protein
MFIQKVGILRETRANRLSLQFEEKIILFTQETFIE